MSEAKSYQIKTAGDYRFALIRWKEPQARNGRFIDGSPMNAESLRTRIANIEAGNAGKGSARVERAALKDLEQ